MHKDGKVMRIVRASIVVFVAAFALVVAPASVAWTADSAASHSSNAEAAVKKARAEAAKALAEAQRAMAEVDAVIRKAESKRKQAQKIEKDAFQKMVTAGYYPTDITLTTPNGRIHAVFSHKKHLLREHLKCTQCHPKIFAMKVGGDVVKKGVFTMESMKEGRYCGTCHNGKKAFSVAELASCKHCHPKQL